MNTDTFPPDDFDEQIAQALRRGGRWWIAPHNTLLPDWDEEPDSPWVEVVRAGAATPPEPQNGPPDTTNPPK